MQRYKSDSSGSFRLSHRLENTIMPECIGGGFVAGNEGSLRYTTTGSNTLSYFYDFNSAALDTLDSWFEPQILIDYLFAPPIHQKQDLTEAVSPFELLSEKNDSAESETPDVHRSEPVPTGPAAPNVLFPPEHIKLQEPIASIGNRPEPGFTEFVIWDPKRESNGVVAEKEYIKTTRKRNFTETAPRKKSKAIGDRTRKRAPHGTICVRCRLQKEKAC